MTLHDATDTALIAEMRSMIEDLTKSLGAWRKRALAALELAEARGKHIAELEAALTRAVTELEQLRCGDLGAFFDGELPADRAAMFRDHLARCQRCQAGGRGLAQEAAVTSESPA